MGYAAPGGQFTRALYEAVAGGVAGELRELLSGERVVELGAGMMPYGYALAASCGARNFVGVEPFYADVLQTSVKAFIEEKAGRAPRIPFKVAAQDMLAYLREEEDDLICVLACGIEDCILPGEEYKRKVEAELLRVVRPGGVFVSSHSDLDPKGMRVTERWFRRLNAPSVKDRVRIYWKE